MYLFDLFDKMINQLIDAALIYVHRKAANTEHQCINMTLNATMTITSTRKKSVYMVTLIVDIIIMLSLLPLLSLFSY